MRPPIAEAHPRWQRPPAGTGSDGDAATEKARRTRFSSAHRTSPSDRWLANASRMAACTERPREVWRPTGISRHVHERRFHATCCATGRLDRAAWRACLAARRELELKSGDVSGVCEQAGCRCAEPFARLAWAGDDELDLHAGVLSRAVGGTRRRGVAAAAVMLYIKHICYIYKNIYRRGDLRRRLVRQKCVSSGRCRRAAQGPRRLIRRQCAPDAKSKPTQRKALLHATPPAPLRGHRWRAARRGGCEDVQARAGR